MFEVGFVKELDRLEQILLLLQQMAVLKVDVTAALDHPLFVVDDLLRRIDLLLEVAVFLQGL